MSGESRNMPVIVDAGTPSVRSLFEAVAQHRPTGLVNIHNAGNWIRLPPWRWPLPSKWRKNPAIPEAACVWQRDVPIAGWTRGERVSTALVIRAVKSAAVAFGADTAVFTFPIYAEAAARLPQFRRIYFAYDPYQFYQWDRERTLKQQQQMVEVCDAIFAVSRTLVEDFRKQTTKPIVYLPNAVSESFVEIMNRRKCSMPNDLAAIGGPIVGCTGQINGSYDWDLIAAVAAAARQVSFVFLGPVVAENAATEARIREIVSENDNIYLLGSCPHAQLPEYLQHFDICFNPLAVNDHNNRRSPLRLFDYLATRKPIVSTAIREAYEHDGLIAIGHDAEECISLLKQMLRGEYPLDIERRQRYILNNSWEDRAKTVMEELRKIVK